MADDNEGEWMVKNECDDDEDAVDMNVRFACYTMAKEANPFHN